MLIITAKNGTVVENFTGQSLIKSQCVLTGYLGDDTTMPPGPYFISTHKRTLHVPYRLYVDTQNAFTTGVVPSTDKDGFTNIPVAVAASSSTTIGVPSRLYFRKTEEKPLAGVRLGVKDIYDLKGLKTGASSRAYFDLYPAKNKTASAVQRLIDAGAVVVGKMKTSQFAAPEFASLAIDSQAPFNARADGYQEPGSSSSGGGAGMSAYDWLDIALGSDTGGSIRVPAYENGLYGNRPSHGYADLDHVVPLGPEFDTAGLLARDPNLWSQASRVLYSGLTENYTTYPKRIQTSGLSNSTETSLSPVDKQIREFVQTLSRHLSADVTQLNYTERWSDTRPAGTNEVLSTYLDTTWEVLTAQPQLELVRTPFFADYAAKYDGRQPYVDPSPRASWDWALSQNPSVEDASLRKATFKAWWNEQIMPTNAESCSDSIVLYVSKDALGATGQPSYRDIQIPGFGIPTGLMGGLFISPMSGVPDFVVPLGQVPYNSSVTKHEEQLPVTINMMAAKGCDLMLFDLIDELHLLGILPRVKTGTSIYGGRTYL